ncbi:hypothetical protein V8046_002721 [Vibrio parahaemolyticus]|nr:hypothetical protein [Vibrio parahaemolyticus]
MKILIWGEYSGFGRSLKKGFREIGLDCDVFSPTGDNWKDISVDISLKKNNKIGKIIELLRLIPTFLKYDRIIYMNPSFLGFANAGPLFILLFFLFRKKTYLLACGADRAYITAGEKGILKRWVYTGISYPRPNFYSTWKDKLAHHLCAMSVKRIVPIMYDYELAWKNTYYAKKLTKVIPLACEVPEVRINPKITNYNRIVILHGRTRPEIKGSDEILKALQKVKETYNNVEIISPYQLPQKEYLDLMLNVDIAVDQCKSNSYGMNGVYSMLRGHILVSSFDEKARDKITNGAEAPVYDIVEDEDVIFDVVSALIKRTDLDKLKEMTINYAYNYHDPSLIAKKYIEIVFDESC